MVAGEGLALVMEQEAEAEVTQEEGGRMVLEPPEQEVEVHFSQRIFPG